MTAMQEAATEALVTAETNRMSAALGPSAATLAPLAMDAEIRSQWVTALRSGEFKQGQQRLRDGLDQRCCLGVLCELAERAGVVTGALIEGDEDLGTEDEWLYGEASEYLPQVVADWAGLQHLNPVVTAPAAAVDHTNVVALTKLNDNHEWTFAQIADAIEGIAP